MAVSSFLHRVFTNVTLWFYHRDFSSYHRVFTIVTSLFRLTIVFSSSYHLYSFIVLVKAFSPSCHRGFPIVTLRFQPRNIAFSTSRHQVFTIVASSFHHRTVAFHHRKIVFSPSRFHHRNIPAISLSRFHHRVFTIVTLRFHHHVFTIVPSRFTIVKSCFHHRKIAFSPS